MANSAGMIKESIWRDKDFRALPRCAQATYCQLLSQKELDRAGMQPLQVSKWAKGCDDITETDIWEDLKLLEARRFVFVDEDTDELFVRSYMRHSEVIKYPQYMKNALRCAGMVASSLLRRELGAELRKLRRAEATKLADELDPDGIDAEPFENRSGTVPAPFRNGASTVNPSGTLREPSGVGEGVGVVTSVGGSVGEATDEPRTDKTAPSSLRNEPPRFCSKDMPDGTDESCHGCRAAREHHDRWEVEHARHAAAARRAELEQAAADRAAEIANCQIPCDDDGYRNGVVCDHVDRTETAAAGRAKVAAALAAKGVDRA